MHKIDVFLDVCETMSMTATANRIFISQPAVSQIIADLEEEYGVTLFERQNRKLYLTSEGVILREYGLRQKKEEQALRNSLQKKQFSSVLKIGSSLTVGPYFLGPVLQQFRLLYPTVDLSLYHGVTPDITQRVARKELNLAVVEGSINEPGLVTQPLIQDRMVLICHERNPLAQLPSPIEPDKLESAPILLREPGSTARHSLEVLFNGLGVSWKESGVFNSYEAIKWGVILELGIGLVPECTINPDDPVKKLEIKGLEIARDFTLVCLPKKNFSEEEKNFIKLLRVFDDRKTGQMDIKI